MQKVQFHKHYQLYENEEIFCLGKSCSHLGHLSPRLKTSCQIELLPSSPLTFSQQILLLPLLPTFSLPTYFYNCYLKSSLWYFMSGLLFVVILLIYFYLCCIFDHCAGFPLVVSRGTFQMQCSGISVQRILLLQSMVSRAHGFSSYGSQAVQL